MRTDRSLYYWTYDIGNAVHGGTKATRDTWYFLSKAGWKSLDTTCSGSHYHRALQLVRHLIAIHRMRRGSIVLVQFPAYGVTSKFLLRIIMRRLSSVVLIHDLESLRGRSVGSSVGHLKYASSIIYTGALQTQLPHLPIPSTTLEAWDYRLDPTHQGPNWDPAGPILFAGNLSEKKNGWLYQNSSARPRLLLYGNQYRKDFNPNVGDDYRGEFEPDKPNFQGPVSWGLIWEGDSTSRRSESAERKYYERFNQPHKLSLYLACSLPVIAWRESAIAEFITRHHCGILVDDLEDIGSELQRYSWSDLEQFRQSAARLSGRIRGGNFIRDAVEQLALLTWPSCEVTDHAAEAN